MAKLSLREQIEKQQKETWEIAELCDTEQMKNKDRIFETGLIMEETELLKKLFRNDDDDDETMKDYLLLLNEMKKFYKRVANSQQVLQLNI